MVAENFNSYVCACCRHRCPHNIMQIGLTNTIDPNVLDLLLSIETKRIMRPSRIRLSTSSNDYVFPNSYIGKSVFDTCSLFHKFLSKKEPQLPEICLKTYDVGP